GRVLSAAQRGEPPAATSSATTSTRALVVPNRIISVIRLTPCGNQAFSCCRGAFLGRPRGRSGWPSLKGLARCVCHTDETNGHEKRLCSRRIDVDSGQASRAPKVSRSFCFGVAGSACLRGRRRLRQVVEHLALHSLDLGPIPACDQRQFL